MVFWADALAKDALLTDGSNDGDGRGQVIVESHQPRKLRAFRVE